MNARGLRLGQLTRGAVADWERIDWFASTAELSRRVTAAVAQRYPQARVHVGYRRLGWDAVAFVAHSWPVPGAGEADEAVAAARATEIARIAGAVYDTGGWLLQRGASQIH